MPSVPLGAVDPLIPLIYQGPLEASPWSTFLESLRLRLDCDGAAISLRLGPAGSWSGVWSTNTAIDASRLVQDGEILAHLSRLDPLGRALSRPGDILTMDEVIPRDELIRTDTWRLYMEPCGIEHQLGMYLCEPTGWESQVGILNGPGRPAFGAAEKRFLTDLRPHLEQALALYARLTRAESEKAILQETLNRLSIGLFFLDAEGAMIDANKAARGILRNSAAVRLVQNRLSLSNGEQNAQLQFLIAEAVTRHLERPDDTFVDAMRVEGRDGRALGIMVRSVNPATPYQGRISPAAIVYIGEPAHPSLVSERFVAQLFGLTPTEAFLTTLLVSGFSLAEAAGKLDITENTARGYLKRVFMKTGVGRQAELVRLVLKSVALLA